MTTVAAPAKDSKALPARLSEEAEARFQSLLPAQRFEKGGYAMVPHSILEIGKKVSGHVQHMLLEAVFHATFGAKGNPEWALIKMTQLAAKSRYTRKAFHLALEDAVERGLLKRRREGKFWLLKTVPENWASVADYTCIHNPGATVTQRDAAGRFCLTVDRPVSMSELFAGVPVEPSDARFVAKIETAAAVGLAFEVATSGLVSVVVHDEEKEKRGLASNPKTPSEYTTVRPLFASIHEALDPIFLKEFRKVPDEPLLGTVIELCDGAPTEMLIARVEEKLKKGAFERSGLIIGLARDVGVAWRAEAQQRAGDVIAAQQSAERINASQCPACQGRGYDPAFYKGCVTGADMTARGDAPDCAVCRGSGRRSAAE